MTVRGTGNGAETAEPWGPSLSNAVVAGWMQEIAPFGIFTTDAELRIQSWNRWLVEHSGLPVERVLGRPLLDVFPDLEKRRLHERFVRALAGEISMLSTALHGHLLPLPVTVADSGLPFMLQTARIAPLPEHNGVVGTITIIEDVTQREFQAGILHRQQELDRLLSTALAALLQSTDPGHDVAEIFPRLLPALGLDVYVSYLLDAEGLNLRMNAAGGLPPKQREILATLLIVDSDRGSRETEARIPATMAAHESALRSLGVLASCSFTLAIGMRLIGLISFGSYERTTLPAADLQILSRIARYLGIALDRALREREVIAASRAKDDFLAALSHELRTPLNPVLLVASDSAENDTFPPAAREAFREIEKNALLEARLIDDLLDLTRIEHGKLHLEMQPLDVHTTLSDAMATVSAEAAARKLVMQVNLASANPTIIGDAARLQQVFWNVLKNAVKFTPARGTISVKSETDAASDEIVIRISDTGIGMGPDEVRRIFGAFSQGDHAEQGRAHRFGGLGLGLAISRKLVELQAGRIEAESAGKNQGSTFIIRLPLMKKAQEPARPQTDTGVTAPASPGGNDAKPPRPNNGRILLVEDHEPTRVPLALLLQRRGFEVVSVATAREALQAVEAKRFDLVLSDIGLPDGDGFELMRVLRERHQLRGIALTGYGTEGDVIRSSDAGFVAHLTKPISVTVLDRTLAELLGADRPIAPE